MSRSSVPRGTYRLVVDLSVGDVIRLATRQGWHTVETIRKGKLMAYVSLGYPHGSAVLPLDMSVRVR